MSATIAFQAQIPYHTLTRVRKMSQSKVVEESACEYNHRISGPTPVYHTLPSVRGVSRSKVVAESACECNHRISGPGPLPHTAKCEEDEPVNGERECV